MSFQGVGFSQNTRTLLVKGTKAGDTIVLNKLEFTKTVTQDSSFVKQLKSIQNQLYSKGFSRHYIHHITKNDSLITVNYYLGKPLKYVFLLHPKSDVFAQLFHLKLTDAHTLQLPITAISGFLQDLVRYYQNTGFPFVKVQLDHFSIQDELLYADLIIIRNKKRFINKVLVKGYSNFPRSFIRYDFGIKPPKIFNQDQIETITEKINGIPFVSEIKKPELLFKKDSTLLYLYLKKVKSNKFDGLIGMVSSEKSKKIQLTGYLNLKLLNILNFGEDFELSWLSNGQESQNLAVKTSLPYLFQTPLSSNYHFTIFKKDSSFISITHNLNLDYAINTSQVAGVSIKNLQSNSIKLTDNQTDYQDITAHYYGLYYRYIKTYNHPIFKTKMRVYTSFLKGKRNKEKQNSLSAEIDLLLPVNKKNMITIKGRSKLLLSDTYYINEMYRIGGSNSIRGFDEQSIFVDKYVYTNLDYNYLINTHTYLSVLSDIGIANNPIDTLQYALYSFGMGYTTQTKIGFIGIQYAIGNTTNTHFSFNNSKIHLKLSQYF